MAKVLIQVMAEIHMPERQPETGALISRMSKDRRAYEQFPIHPWGPMAALLWLTEVPPGVPISNLVATRNNSKATVKLCPMGAIKSSSTQPLHPLRQHGR